MVKYFDLPGARRLFQDVDARHLHQLALLQPKDLPIVDKGQLSSSWSDYFISLRPSYVTARHDGEYFIET